MTYQKRAPQVALLCYLCDTRESNGELRILPGSHMRSSAIHVVLPEAHGLAGDLDPEHPAMSGLPGQRTVAAEAGDAVVIDYRVLHGKHGNSTAIRRDCVLLSFVPSWRNLPAEIRAHLILHRAQPSHEEVVGVSPSIAKFLPKYDGEPRSLALNRNAPPVFEIIA